MSQPTTRKILVEKQKPVTTVVINRPEVRNGLDGESARALAAAFAEFEADPEALARQITAFPRIAMRADRRSAYAQDGLDMEAALAQETDLAQQAKALEAQAGAARFAAGAGRHGGPDER